MKFIPSHPLLAILLHLENLLFYFSCSLACLPLKSWESTLTGIEGWICIDVNRLQCTMVDQAILRLRKSPSCNLNDHKWD